MKRPGPASGKPSDAPDGEADDAPPLDDLRQLGLKATLPRLQVLQALRNASRRHLSAEELHQVLLAHDRDVSLATVYRVLGQLERAGMLARRQFDGGAAVYEFNDGQHHDHLVCVVCGRVEEFEDPVIEDRQFQLAEQRGFRLTEHRLSLFGRCADCCAAGRHASRFATDAPR